MTSRWHLSLSQLMAPTLILLEANQIFLTIDMTNKCFVCKKTGVSLHSLPIKDTERCNEWLLRLQSAYRVPEHISIIKGYRVCSAHFRDCDQYYDGKRRRLFRNVYPVEIPPEKRMEASGSSEEPAAAPPAKVRKRDVAIQVASALGRGSVYALKLAKKVERLKEKNKSMVNNLKPKWVLKNRHKLASFMSDEAYMLFDCHIRNYGRARQGRRFTPDDKNLTNKIRLQSPEAYRVLQKIFTLPTQKALDAADELREQSVIPEDNSSKSSTEPSVGLAEISGPFET